VLVPARMIVDGRDDVEPVFPVEPRCLEGEGHQDDLGAAAPSRLLLGRLVQRRPEAAVAQRFLDPELTQLAGPAPRVPADARDDAIRRAHEEREQFAIADAGDARIELVDPIFQVLHVVWRWLGRIQRDLAHFTCPGRTYNEAIMSRPRPERSARRSAS